MTVLGISCYYHDSAATLVKKGQVKAAVAEERFSRSKHDNSFPSNAINYCLEAGDIDIDDVDKIVFYEKPIQKFERILETTATTFPQGFKFFSEAAPEWLGTKLRVKKKIRKETGFNGRIEFVEHHTSHAASAFYPSPYSKAAILTVDGVGGWTTNQMFKGENGQIDPLKEIKFPHSIGLLYSTITAFLGFMVNNDEYKVMGLASYGKPKYLEEFRKMIEIHNDGSYDMEMKYFSYTKKSQMWNQKLEKLLGPPRSETEDITQRHKNLAATLQTVLQEVLLKQVNHLYSITNTENLCMAGGVALNSAANGKIREEMPFENIWIQPAAGDAGGSMGAALERSPEKDYQMEHAYLGPEYDMEDAVNNQKHTSTSLNKDQLLNEIVSRLTSGDIIGLYQGRTEWGPRALGNRSIIADPRNKDMVDIINKKVKFREAFRPFAPTILHEKRKEYFKMEKESPYMLFVHDVREEKKNEIPAVTHVDNTSRMQTLKRNTNPFFYDLLSRFHEQTGTPVLLNTSFNLKGMPIVNKPEEALKVLEKSGLNAVATREKIIEERSNISGR